MWCLTVYKLLNAKREIRQFALVFLQGICVKLTRYYCIYLVLKRWPDYSNKDHMSVGEQGPFNIKHVTAGIISPQARFDPPKQRENFISPQLYLQATKAGFVRRTDNK